jgi:hypothetical protein
MRVVVSSILTFVTLLALGIRADAQVIFIHFKDEKLAKRYDEYLTTFQGQPALIGEPRDGITVNKEGVINYTSGGEAKNTLWMSDPAKPSNVPYEMKGAAKVAAKGGKTLSIPGDVIQRIGYVDRFLTLAGVSEEYERRVGLLKELRAERDAIKKGERAWFHVHGRVILDGLSSWLTQMGFAPAAKKHKADLERERKVVAKEATAAREKAALASVHAVETPDHLTEVAATLLGGKTKYNVRESMHGRIVYPTDKISDGQAEHALQLMEQLIEGFRRKFVDPYLDENYPDYIPDEVFGEFFFSHNTDEAYVGFFKDYYGLSFGNDHYEERIKMGGTFARTRDGYLNYSRIMDQDDLDGRVAHVTGHWLAELHYAGGGFGAHHDWLQEAVGYYLSFEYLGRNTLTCFNWNTGGYAKAAEKEGEKTVQSGQKGNFNDIALKIGPTFDQLVLKGLADFNDADLAKAWSFYDYVAKKLGRKGQDFLRQICMSAARSGKGYLERERAMLEEWFDVKGRDVYGYLDERWKEYAKTDQLR